MSERKFKIGDVVKPIKTDPDSHNFEDWEILTITRVSDGDPNLFECTRSDGNWDLLWGFELELVEEDKVEEVKRELRVGDRVVMTKLDSEAFTFDKVGNTGKVIWADPFLIGIKVDGVDLPSCSYYRKDRVWEPIEESTNDRLYSHEEVAEILGISENEVETVSVDITPKEYDRFEWNKPDMVNHPKHYTKGGIETLDFILAKVEGLTPQEAFLFGQIIRYVSRYNDKFNPVEDLKKARFFLEKLIELREELEY